MQEHVLHTRPLKNTDRCSDNATHSKNEDICLYPLKAPFFSLLAVSENATHAQMLMPKLWISTSCFAYVRINIAISGSSHNHVCMEVSMT